MLDRLDHVIADLTLRTDIATLIFTGRDNAFLSGANIRELTVLDHNAALAFSQRGQRLFQRIAASRQTSIAAINGFCMGGGLDFALACDLRIAAPLAEFAHPGAQLGIITGWGGTQRLPRIIGRTRAMEFFTTARRLKADEALNVGLITAVDPAPVEYALRLAERS
jgi:enoyl-CoA hydratase